MSDNKKTAYEIVMENRKTLVEQIINQMQSGNLVWRAGWNRESLRPHNPVSEAFYKGGNRLKLIIESESKGYKDPRWVTYKQAQEKDWHIKKGAKGVLLEKWIFTKEVHKRDIINGIEQDVSEVIQLNKPRVNFFYVYNAEQVVGIPELNIEPRMSETEQELIDLAETLKASSECPIIELVQDGAFYSPLKDTITLPPKESFISMQEYIATMSHEMAHSTGHESRLNRPLMNAFGTEDYAKEELRAELGSVFIQSELGLEVSGKVMENHAAYLQSWIKTIKEDYNEFYRACKDAETISERIIENYDREKMRELTKQEDKELKTQQETKIEEENVLNSFRKGHNPKTVPEAKENHAEIER